MAGGDGGDDDRGEFRLTIPVGLHAERTQRARRLQPFLAAYGSGVVLHSMLGVRCASDRGWYVRSRRAGGRRAECDLEIVLVLSRSDGRPHRVNEQQRNSHCHEQRCRCVLERRTHIEPLWNQLNIRTDMVGRMRSKLPGSELSNLQRIFCLSIGIFEQRQDARGALLAGAEDAGRRTAAENARL